MKKLLIMLMVVSFVFLACENPTAPNPAQDGGSSTPGTDPGTPGTDPGTPESLFPEFFVLGDYEAELEGEDTKIGLSFSQTKLELFSDNLFLSETNYTDFKNFSKTDSSFQFDGEIFEEQCTYLIEKNDTDLILKFLNAEATIVVELPIKKVDSFDKFDFFVEFEPVKYTASGITLSWKEIENKRYVEGSELEFLLMEDDIGEYEVLETKFLSEYTGTVSFDLEEFKYYTVICKVKDRNFQLFEDEVQLKKDELHEIKWMNAEGTAYTARVSFSSNQNIILPQNIAENVICELVNTTKSQTVYKDQKITIEENYFFKLENLEPETNYKVIARTETGEKEFTAGFSTCSADQDAISYFQTWCTTCIEYSDTPVTNEGEKCFKVELSYTNMGDKSLQVFAIPFKGEKLDSSNNFVTAFNHVVKSDQENEPLFVIPVDDKFHLYTTYIGQEDQAKYEDGFDIDDVESLSMRSDLMENNYCTF